MPEPTVTPDVEKPFTLNRKQVAALGFMTDAVARHTLL